MVARTAKESVSAATTDSAPRPSAARPSTPLPQPRSAMSDPTGGDCSKASRQSRVVGWLPVPKALPGSILITSRSACSGGTSSQAGRINSPVPTGSACQCCFQLRLQSSSATSSQCPSGRLRPKGSASGCRLATSSRRCGSGHSGFGSQTNSVLRSGVSGACCTAWRCSPRSVSFHTSDSSSSGGHGSVRRHHIRA